MKKRKLQCKEKELKQLGYCNMSATDQVLYIIKYVVKNNLRTLRLRFKLYNYLVSEDS